MKITTKHCSWNINTGQLAWLDMNIFRKIIIIIPNWLKDDFINSCIDPLWIFLKTISNSNSFKTAHSYADLKFISYWWINHRLVDREIDIGAIKITQDWLTLWHSIFLYHCLIVYIKRSPIWYARLRIFISVSYGLHVQVVSHEKFVEIVWKSYADSTRIVME